MTGVQKCALPIYEYKGQVREIIALDCTSDEALEQADIASSDTIII